jgi:hypothetical protein
MFKRNFDADWYLAVYPDIAEAVEAGRFASAWAHYKDFGRAEGRLPMAPPFNEQFYLNNNPDVRRAIERGEFLSALDHYVKCGHAEGRSTIPPPLFD